MNINKFIKKKNGMYQLVLDNNTILLHEDLILKYDLLLKKEINDKEIDKYLEENKVYEIKEVALSYINKKLRSNKELYNYLEKKGYEDSLIDETVCLLKKEGYLDNKVFSLAYVHDRINLSNEGPNKIKSFLENNNIEESIVEEAMSSYTIDLEKERIEKLVDKQIKLNNNKGANLLKRKIQAYLLNLGYNYDLINEVLNSKNLVNEDAYKKEYDKIYNTLSKKYSGKELEYRLKQKLYQKGFIE